MALKIVHLCDVHSVKGEDVPAQYAHTMTLDGGTYAIDLCPQCDNERFMPLAAFLESFGLLTDGVVDPREAVAENLRMTVAQLANAAAPAQKTTQKRPAAPVRDEPPAPAPVAPPSPEEALSDDPDVNDRDVYPITRARRAKVLAMLNDAAEGLSAQEITERLDDPAATVDGIRSSVLTPLRERGRIDFLGQRWWAPQNVPQKMRDDFARQRAIVAARDTVPRVCPVEGETFSGTSLWDDHCQNAHHMKPAQLLGLICPLDGEEFSAPQVLGMHGRTAHNCVHTPQLFERAALVGDPLGIVEDARKRAAEASA